MTTRLDELLESAALAEPERRVIERFVATFGDALGDELLAVWLYGSRARGEKPHVESDVDLLAIVEGDSGDRQRLASDLSEAAAIAEGESPFAYSVHVYDREWLRGRRKIESFFIGEVDRDKIVLAGSGLPEGGTG